MTTKPIQLSILVSVFFILISCSSRSDSTTESATEEAEVSNEIPMAVCLGNNVSVRSTPSPEGDRLTSLAIGESVEWLDSTALSGDYEYALVRLSDGTEGWAVGSYLFEGSQLAVAVQSTTIYNRPDLLTSTNTAFEPLDLIARPIIDPAASSSDWVEVTGRRDGTKGFTNGWIKTGQITSNEKDVLLAQMVYKANEKKGKERMAALKEIIARPEFKYTQLIGATMALTYLDPEALLKPELEQYYKGMLTQWDSSNVDYSYQYEEGSRKITILGTEYGSFRYGDWYNNNHYHIWNYFFDFSNYLASSGPYEAEGYYQNYYDLADRLYAMEDLSGVSVYTRYTEDYSDFSRLNPEFVTWVTDNLFPHPDNDFLGPTSQKIYDVVFQENARYTFKQWRLMNEQYEMGAITDEYEREMSNPDGFSGYYFLLETFRESGVDPVLAGVFIRRRIDGTYDHVVNAMRKALTLYDKEWYDETRVADPYLFFPVDESDYEGDYDEDYYDEEDY